MADCYEDYPPNRPCYSDLIDDRLSYDRNGYEMKREMIKTFYFQLGNKRKLDIYVYVYIHIHNINLETMKEHRRKYNKLRRKRKKIPTTQIMCNECGKGQQ